MKKQFLSFLLILFLLSSLYSQNFKWANNIDTNQFRVSKTKSKIPKGFYEKINIQKKEIANHKTNFSAGCTGSGKHTLCNWVATNVERNKFVISLSFGGRAHYTKFYLITIKNKQCYLREIKASTFSQNLSFEKLAKNTLANID